VATIPAAAAAASTTKDSDAAERLSAPLLTDDPLTRIALQLLAAVFWSDKAPLLWRVTVCVCPSTEYDTVSDVGTGVMTAMVAVDGVPPHWPAKFVPVMV
jgi:hypothetical protein